MSEYLEKKDGEDPKDPRVLAAKWTKEIAASKKWLQKWHSSGATIEREYLAQPVSGAMVTVGESAARYNIFWANVQVQLAAVYTKLPVPEVDRTHFDQNDDVARVAALILERIFSLELKNLDESPFDTYKLAIQDRFVPGMGVVWPRYDFKEQQTQMPAITGDDGKELAPAYEKTIVTDERVPLDYVRWDDFFYSPCRTWPDRRWQARRVFWEKAKCVERFGKLVAEQLQYKANSTSKYDNDPHRITPEPNAEIFEIWDKDTLCVSWWSAGCPVVLDYKVNPLGLSGFFPAKKPLMATHISTSFIPRPDYVMVQDQYSELNLIASRTTLLTQALKLVGVYDKDSEGLQRMINQASQNQLIPVDNWAMFAEKGGIKGVVDWVPLEMVANTLEQLTRRKAALLQEIYEILGLSDIMRGQSVASETATAQQLKAQYGSARMQHVQNDIAEFITEATRTRAEIICLHWSPETIIERSQIMATPDAQYAPQAVQLLKSNTQMALRLTVHADTIAAPDWNQEKQLRVDFLQAISQFITMSMPLLEQTPGAAPFLIQVMQWAAAGFKGGKQIEGVLDQALMALQKKPQQPSLSEREQKAMKERADSEMAAAKREADLKAQVEQLKLKAVVDKALADIKDLVTRHECEVTVALVKDAAKGAVDGAEAAGADDANKAAETAQSMQKMHKEFLGQLLEVVEQIKVLSGPRSVNITLPDGSVASAQSSYQGANGGQPPAAPPVTGG